jgi:hypothetical protein
MLIISNILNLLPIFVKFFIFVWNYPIILLNYLFTFNIVLLYFINLLFLYVH